MTNVDRGARPGRRVWPGSHNGPRPSAREFLTVMEVPPVGHVMPSLKSPPGPARPPAWSLSGPLTCESHRLIAVLAPTGTVLALWLAAHTWVRRHTPALPSGLWLAASPSSGVKSG